MKTPVNKGEWPRTRGRIAPAGAPTPPFGRVVGLLEYRTSYSKADRKWTVRKVNSGLTKYMNRLKENGGEPCQ